MPSTWPSGPDPCAPTQGTRAREQPPPHSAAPQSASSVPQPGPRGMHTARSLRRWGNAGSWSTEGVSRVCPGQPAQRHAPLPPAHCRTRAPQPRPAPHTGGARQPHPRRQEPPRTPHTLVARLMLLQLLACRACCRYVVGKDWPDRQPARRPVESRMCCLTGRRSSAPAARRADSDASRHAPGECRCCGWRSIKIVINVAVVLHEVGGIRARSLDSTHRRTCRRWCNAVDRSRVRVRYVSATATVL